MAIPKAHSANYWHLKNSGISQAVGQSALQRLAYVMDTRTHERDETLLLPKTGLCFVLEGCIGVSRIDPSSGKEIMLYLVKAGEFFGNPSGGNGDGQASVAKALQNSRVGYVDKRNLRGLMLDDEFRGEVQRNLESRLQHLENRIVDLLFNKVKSRLTRFLIELSEDFPGQCPEGRGTLIATTLTQNDIARVIAASREITNLTLNDLRRAGVLAFHGRRICIHDMTELEKLSGERS